MAIPINTPEDVWAQDDADYRWPHLEVEIAGTKLDFRSNVKVREATFTISPTRTRMDFNMILFDPTMVTVATLFNLSAFRGRENRIRVSFGWGFPGGYLEPRDGTVLGIKHDITPEGFEYTLRGYIDYVAVAPETSDMPLVFENLKLSELVTKIATEFLGMEAGFVIVQETSDTPKNWPVPAGTTVMKYLDLLAEEATKTLPQDDTKNPDKVNSWFDSFGRYHFHTYAYEVQKLIEPKVTLSWPYPRPDRPVIEFAVADVEWVEMLLVAHGMDALTGEHILAEGDFASDEETKKEAEPLAEEGICTARHPDYDQYIEEASQALDVSVALINAIIRQESKCDPNAGSVAGAQGLMQLLPGTARQMESRARDAAKAAGFEYEDIAANNIFDPRTNIFLGTSYLNFGMTTQIPNCKDIEVIAAGYNAGYGNASVQQCQLPSAGAISPWGRKAAQKEADRIKAETGEDVDWRTLVPSSAVGEAHNYGKTVGKYYLEYATGREVLETKRAGRVGRRFEVKVPIKMAPLTREKFMENMFSVGRAMSEREMYADITLMGNIYIEHGDMLQIDIIPPKPVVTVGGVAPKLEHLSGLWFSRQVVHNVTDAGFVTRLNLVRFWSANKDAGNTDESSAGTPAAA